MYGNALRRIAINSINQGGARWATGQRLRLSKATAILILLLAVSLSFGQKVDHISLSPVTVTGGDKVTATVVLTSPAPAAGATVVIEDTGESNTFYDHYLKFPGGAALARFVIQTDPVQQDTRVLLRATLGTFKTTTLTMKAPIASGLTLSETSVTGGTTDTSGKSPVVARVTLNGPAPIGGVIVSLKSNNASATVPASVIVAATANTATFYVDTKSVNTIAAAVITATLNTKSVTANLKVLPPTLSLFSLTPSSVSGGIVSSGAVELTGGASPSGNKVLLTSSNKAAVVPASVTVTHGTTSAFFNITTTPVITDTVVKITAKLGTTSITKSLTVQKVGVSTFTISPTGVQGGTGATATVTLNGKAPTGGYLLKFAHDQTFASLPSTATIGAGQTGTTVPITTSKVTATGLCTFTLTDPSGGTMKAALTVTPVGSGLAISAWPKYHHDNLNSSLGTGKGATGHVKWKFTAQGAISSSPVVGPDGTIYFGSSDTNFYAVDGSTGKLKWKYKTGGTIDSSPTLGSDGTIYFGGWDGYFYALDSATGKLKWTFTVGSYVSSGAALTNDGTVIFGCADHLVYAVNGVDGHQKWAFVTGAEVVSTPALDTHGSVYFGSNDMNVYSVNVATGAQNWAFKTNGSVVASPVITSSGLVCFGSYDSNFYAVDANLGTKTWAYKLTREIVTSAAIASDGTLVFGSSDTNFYALSPTGSLLWKNAAQGTLMSSPTISGDGTIYLIASDGNFYAVPSAGGASVWHLKLGTYGRSSAAVGTDGTLYVGSTDSNLYAIN